MKTIDTEVRVPAVEASVSNTTGCGDKFSDGFTAGLAMNYGQQEAGLLDTAA